MTKVLRQRRAWLKKTLALSIAGGGASALSTHLNLMNSALAADDYSGITDYKALVCVFLYGGSDSFNLFLPANTTQLDTYATSRGSLALDSATLLPSNNNSISFNPQLGAMRDYYDAGQLAVISNVGNLIQPVSRADYLNETAIVPADLFAHNRQQEQVMKGYASQPTSVIGTGWGGRMADLLMQANTGTDFSPSLSMRGSNYFLPGNLSTPIAVNPVRGPETLTYLDPNVSGSRNTARAATLQRILALPTSHPIKQFAGSSFARARDSSRAIIDAIDNSPNFVTPIDSGNDLATQLRMVARMISGRQALGVKRQMFFVSLGGWDTHDNQTPRLVNLAAELNAGLSSFQETLAEMSIQNEVTTFTMSDFGRTLTVNGDGSDHGWGGHYVAMGGAVNGGQLIGNWPSYELNGANDADDKGRIIPELSINQFGAAMGSWMGLSNTDLLDVFPDLANFDTAWQQRLGLFV